MIILLPDNTKTSLEEVESKLTVDYLLHVEKVFEMRKQKVFFWVPRFKLEEALELSSVLAKIGMVDMFEGGRADFSGMDGTKKAVCVRGYPQSSCRGE
jgi:serpin B